MKEGESNFLEDEKESNKSDLKKFYYKKSRVYPAGILKRFIYWGRILVYVVAPSTSLTYFATGALPPLQPFQKTCASGDLRNVIKATAAGFAPSAEVRQVLPASQAPQPQVELTGKGIKVNFDHESDNWEMPTSMLVISSLRTWSRKKACNLLKSRSKSRTVPC